MQPWTEKLQRKTGRRYEARGGKSELMLEFWVLFWLLQVGHTVRFESVRRKRDTSLNQKSVKSCYIGVLFRGEPLERFFVLFYFFSGRFGTQWRTPMDSLHQGFGWGGQVAKSGKEV